MRINNENNIFIFTDTRWKNFTLVTDDTRSLNNACDSQQNTLLDLSSLNIRL